MACVSKFALSPVSPNRWIIDSGATNHIINSSKLFVSSQKNISLPPVSLPSGAKAHISMKGSIKINDAFFSRCSVCTFF